MKIRSENELIDFLAERKQKRKRELISINSSITITGRNAIQQTCRCAIVFSYAHWEGFVKEAAQSYVNLVSFKNRPLHLLSNCFQALVCRQQLNIASSSKKKIASHLAIVTLFNEGKEKASSIDANTAIDTESNLSYNVFENICTSIGINCFKTWSEDGPFMDDLLTARCSIAHGELFAPDENYSREVIDKVIKWIDNFSTDIENAAVQRVYLRAS